VKKPKVVAIVQARMGSTRLPGKVLKPVLDKSLLEYQVLRIRQSEMIDEVRIATSDRPIDDVLELFAGSLGVKVTRGSEKDVISRFQKAAAESEATTVLRLTADCPLIASSEIDRVLQRYATGQFDYVSNVMQRSYPRGMDCEVFSFEALNAAFTEAKRDFEREHVTPFIINNPQRFRLGNVPSPLGDHQTNRWTVDTPEDFELIKRILEDVVPRHGIGFSYKDLLDCISRNPEWPMINAHIEQKKI
jgi:spore coat polysaccharide biosynthesis protein SpsF